MSNLSVVGVKVRQDSEGRYSLNDLHKAAVEQGENKRTKEPSAFMRSPQTVSLVGMLTTQNPRSLPIAKVEGRKGGTFVCKEIVYAYAMWISPEFHLRVIQSYDALVNGEIQKAIDIATRQTIKDEYLPMTSAIKESRLLEGKEVKHFHYSNENNMIYRVLLGQTAKEYKESHGTDSVRDSLTLVEKQALLSLQRANTSMLELGYEYDKRKEELGKLYQRVWLDKLTKEHLMLEG